ncbi:uncharacterized protein LOC131844813 [Achroia grisella]|uniref:uncharacterized protein LOC131844813 n=1 Tax=Achroia grisella TaxID=688607 RepID=UPI0027D30B30|nr:uncharacterized protein LOC131844813 [Achroia grisella]
MASKYQILLVALTVQFYVSAAPSEEKKPEELVNIEQTDGNLNSKTLSLLDVAETETNGQQSQREKRWYNFYGFPPINPSYNSGYGKKDNSFNPGYEDPFVEIHRRLQELSGIVRQPAPSFPSFSSNNFPFYLPVFYVPQSGCDCPTQTESPQTTPDNKKNTTSPSPNIETRFPEMEDNRQNWGVVNEIGTTTNEQVDDYDENDGARPISFEPIQPNTPISRPAPPVEHGSSQGNADEPITTTPGSFQASTTINPIQNPTTVNPISEAPSACDGAVLSCCHQLQVTYDCFALQGCPDPTAYGNPCDSNVILRVINRFQSFYGQRTG